MHALDKLHFDNRFARLSEQFHTRLKPAPIPDPYLVSANPEGATLIGLDLAEIAIRRASGEKDYSEVNRLLSILQKPFDEQPEFGEYAKEPPEWAQKIAVSCSS